MFGFVRALITKIMEYPIHANNANANIDLAAMDPIIKTIDIDSIDDRAPVTVPVPKHNASETDVINAWKMAAKDDIAPLIAMIQHLCFFSDCRKFTIRTYQLNKEDMPRYISKIKRHPEFQIDVSDVDVHNHPQMFAMYKRLHFMIGMHRINDFMVRVEHVFDNSQIESEHFVVSQLTKHSNGGIDTVHHMVLPTCVQLNNLCKIPPNARTLFHHISYSIQPIVHHSQTLDACFNSAIVPPTIEQIMGLCIQMAKALAHLHASGIVHGDVKPGNTLIQTIYEYASSSSSSSSSSSDSDSESESHSRTKTRSFSLYLIDFGMSGSPGHSDGTGGTKPFCAPETGNGFNPAIDIDTYNWTKVQKHHDVWSFALMFFTIIVLRKSTSFPKDYPSDFFDVARNGHINPMYFNRIRDEPTRDLFRRALCPAEERITAAEFLAAAIGTDIVSTCRTVSTDSVSTGRTVSTDSVSTDSVSVSTVSTDSVVND